jgi:hypothetical protein
MQVTIEIPEDSFPKLIASLPALKGTLVAEDIYDMPEWVKNELDKRLALNDEKDDISLSDFMIRYRERGI